MTGVAERLLDWFERHGRHDLPWQRDRRPYAIWVSEIMLQQTQVATVVAYFDRFIARFPSVRTLADAELDDVLRLWSGLGYYARARNLHRAAAIIAGRHGGELPATLDELTALPGIGRSTAGAILALSRGQPQPILDGNVKRVLSRYEGIEGWPGSGPVQKRLWERSEAHLPAARVAEYTQAVMDLGATVCTRVRPGCDRCPLGADCVARLEARQHELPAPRPKRLRPSREVWIVIAEDETRRVLLERRPASGVWGGLFSFPEVHTPDAAEAWCRRALGAAVREQAVLEPIQHAFTHFDLTMRPLWLRLERPTTAADRDGRLWHRLAEPCTAGVPAPVRALLERAAAGRALPADPAVRHAGSAPAFG